MTKPIFATKLVGIIVKKEAWEKAHTIWFEDAAKKLDRPDIKDWGTIYTQKNEYFPKVDEIMQIQYPDLTNEQRTEKTKTIFFKYVLKYINKYPNVINQEIIKELKKLKEKYILAIISTSEKQFLLKILEQLKILDLFDIIEATSPNEKENKDIVYNRFCEKYGKPEKYVEDINEI